MRNRSIVLLIVLATGCGTTPRRAAPRPCVIRVYFCTDSTCASAATRAQISAAEARFHARADVWSVRRARSGWRSPALS